MIDKNITFGKSIKVCDGIISVSGCVTPEDADLKVKDLVISMGYRPPAWWKFWDQKTWTIK